MTGIRKRHTKEFKLKVVLAALAGDRPVAQIAQEHSVHPQQIKVWKDQVIEPKHPQVSVRRQCVLLSLNRTSLYLKPRPTGATNERLMRRLDELFTGIRFWATSS